MTNEVHLTAEDALAFERALRLSSKKVPPMTDTGPSEGELAEWTEAARKVQFNDGYEGADLVLLMPAVPRLIAALRAANARADEAADGWINARGAIEELLRQIDAARTDTRAANARAERAEGTVKALASRDWDLENDMLLRKVDERTAERDAALARAERAEADNKLKDEALRPFADVSDDSMCGPSANPDWKDEDDWWRHDGASLSVGDFRRARAALTPAVQGGEAPGHTDLMVTPESIDAFMEANPLPAQPGAAEE